MYKNKDILIQNVNAIIKKHFNNFFINYKKLLKYYKKIIKNIKKYVFFIKNISK